MEDFVKIVEELNANLYDLHKEQEKCFNYTTNGYVDVILFEDNILWCSEMDDREWDETTGEYKESLISHIKILYNEWVDSLVKLKFKKTRKK